MNDEWNAIDLHMHTCVGITGDGKNDVINNFSYLNFIRALKIYKIKLASITNHNVIDIVNFLICRYLAKQIETNLLFGVEIDTDRETGENYHFVAVFNESFPDCIEISKTINANTNQKSKNGKVRYKSSEIVDLIRKYNVIIIPHGNKSKGLLERPTETQLKDALKKVRDGFIRVFDSPSDWKLEQIKNIIEDKAYEDFDDGFGGVLFSDNRDWKNYGAKFRNFYMNAEPTFNGFLHSITNPTERFATKDYIPAKHSYISKISIRKNNQNARIDNCDIILDSGYNCIIGKSGSGKSLLHFIILKSLLGNTNQRINNTAAYSFVEDNSITLYDEKGKVIQPEEINCGVGERIFDRIITASTTRDTNDMYKVISILDKDFKPEANLKKFIEKYSSYLKEYSKLNSDFQSLQSKFKSDFNSFSNSIKTLASLKDIESFEFKIPDDQSFEYSEDSLEKIRSTYKNIKEIKDSINYLNENDRIELVSQIEKFETTFIATYKRILISDRKIKFGNLKKKIVRKALASVNSNISSNAQRKTTIFNSMRESISSLCEEIIKIYKLKIGLSRFDFSIDCRKINRDGELIKGSGITFSEKIDESIIKKLDVKQNNVFHTYGIQQKINSSIYDMSKPAEAKKVIDIYIQNNKLNDADIKKIFQNVEMTVDVFFDRQNVKELNPGDISKKYIQTYFNCELANGINSIILYDQIENDVDKPFISGPLVNMIDEMKKKAQLIIVTHDPIVAVNADPVNYIEAKKDDFGHISYRSFRPESEVKDELSEIAKCVDGSKVVIRERYEIYKGDKSYAEN